MSNDIRISIGFWTHHKTVKLERRLSLAGVKSLLILWTWAAQNRPNGVLDGMDAEDIEIAAMWAGEPGAFIKALAEIVWLDFDGNTYSIHGWSEHQPWVIGAEARRDKARKAASVRWGTPTGKPDACSEHATGMPDAMPSSSPCLSLGLKSSPSDNGSEVVQPSTHMATPDGAAAPVEPEPAPAPVHVPAKRTKKAAKAPAEYSASFLAFWEAYPRKVGKAAAFEAWQAVGARMKAEGRDARGILAAIKDQVAAGHLGADIQHVPHPTTWLNQARWEDEIAPPGALPAPRGNPPQPRTFHQKKQAENEQKAEMVLQIIGAENGQKDAASSSTHQGGHALSVGQVGT